MKPKGTLSLLSILKRELQKIPKELKGKERKQYAELLVKKQLHKAIVEGDDASIRLIWNYVEGMPKESHDVNLTLPVPLLKNIKKNVSRDNGSLQDIKTEEED